MFKLIGHLVVFVVGAGVGIYWGVNHPSQAADISNAESAKIQQAVAAAKTQVMQQVVAEQNASPDAAQPNSTTAAHLSKYQQMLQSAQAELNTAKAKVNGQ